MKKLTHVVVVYYYKYQERKLAKMSIDPKFVENLELADVVGIVLDLKKNT